MVNQRSTNAYSCRPILIWIPLLPSHTLSVVLVVVEGGHRGQHPPHRRTRTRLILIPNSSCPTPHSIRPRPHLQIASPLQHATLLKLKLSSVSSSSRLSIIDQCISPSLLAHPDDDDRRPTSLEILSRYQFFCPPFPTWHLAIWIMGFAGDMHSREYWYALLGLPSYMVTPMTHYSSQIQARSLVKAFIQLSDLHQ